MKLELCKPLLSAALLMSVFVVGCKPQQAVPPRPVPEVAVVTVVPTQLVLTTELPGRTSSFRMSEIRPQVNGLIQKRLFVEGSDVKAGQTLYEIDPAPFAAASASANANLDATRKGVDRAQAAVNAGMANVASQQATLSLAKTNRQRFEELFKERAVSASERDRAATDEGVAQAALSAAEAQVQSDRAAVSAAEAMIKQAQASLDTSGISLGYTKITAPISGKIGRSAVTEGAAVTAFQPMALAMIQELDPIYVDVPQSTAELNRLKNSLKSGRIQQNAVDTQKVKLVMEDGSVYPHEGMLKFRDVTVDPTTGSVILRIVVPNPDTALLPGMFVRAIIEEGVDSQAILVPQQAVSRNPQGNPTVLIVDAQSKVQQRLLTTDRALKDMWLVSSGLVKGDRVIVEGVQKVRPGMSVSVVAMETKAAKAEMLAAPATKSN